MLPTERKLTLSMLAYILTVKEAEFETFALNELYFILGNQEIVTANLSGEELLDVLDQVIRW